MKPRPEYGTCPTCKQTGLPLTPGGRMKAHWAGGARGNKCKGGRPSTGENTTDTRSAR